MATYGDSTESTFPEADVDKALNPSLNRKFEVDPVSSDISTTKDIQQVSGKPIKLVGRGERMEDLEPLYPNRMAGRILGMGDVLSFVEKAQEVMRQEDAEELQQKIMSANFDFNDFLKQTRAVAKMGSMTRVMGMIPGMAKVTPAKIREAEKNLKIMEAMIEVMTPDR